jgi:hypothetical protein
MRVGFTDPQGPRLWRTAAYAVPVLMLLFGVFGPVHEIAATMINVASVAIFNLIGLVGLRQRKPRNAELHCGPGYIEIKKSGSRNQRVSAKDITGATTSRTERGLVLTLQHQKRDQPITLELENDADTDAVRHALGIGHGGFGTIAWRTHSDTTTRAAFIGRLLAFSVALLTIALTLGVSHDTGFVVGILLGQFGMVGAILGVIGLLAKGPEPTVVMATDGLRLKTPRGWFALPYDAVRHLEDHRRGLVFTVPEPYNTVAVERVGPVMGGPSESDRAVLVAQIMAAAQRARGMGPQKTDVTGRVDVLRRKGESSRDWLVRLDMAGQMLSAGVGYRGNTLDTVDLWAILEDPDAEPELRAAAARVLRHAPNTRVRIDAAVAAVRDEVTNRRLRIAIRDDLDAASQELAFLDASEPRPPQARAVNER